MDIYWFFMNNCLKKEKASSKVDNPSLGGTCYHIYTSKFQKRSKGEVFVSALVKIVSNRSEKEH